MGQNPPAGGSRKTPPHAQSPGPPLGGDDYGDYADFEADSTNVNQIPQPGGPAPRASMPPAQPAMFPQGSPHLSHMGGPPAMPNPAGMATNPGAMAPMQMPGPPMAQVSGVISQPTPYVSRSRIYAFVVDETGMPIELGSGRFAKAYLGESRWVESKT